MSHCPDANAIQGFLSGRVDDVERSRIEVHIDVCDDCRRAIADHAATSATVADVPEGNDAMPAQIARYRIKGKLGSGGMGVVYRGHDPELRRDVALKLLRTTSGDDYDTAGARARLAREAQAMARVSHPNVVTVYEAGVWEGQVFVAMELATGGTLRTWQRNRSRRDILDAYSAAGRGLAAAHAAGLVHRDFKPDNVLIGADGRIRVTDFGLARRAGTNDGAAAMSGMIGVALTMTGAVMGTPAYMAPEQFDGGTTDARSDQFAFCVALWEALHGSRPFVAASLPARRESIKRGVIGRGRVDRALARGLREDHDARWPTMDALLAALAPPRKAWIATAGAAVAAGGALVVALSARGGSSDACSAASAKMDAAWGFPARMSVHVAYETKQLGAKVGPAEGALDDYAARWRAAAIDVCHATALGDDTRHVFELRERCLDRRAANVAALVSQIVTEPALFDRTSVVAALPALDICSDDVALLEDKVPPPDPTLEPRIAAVELAMQRAMHRGNMGDMPGALEDTAHVVEQARAVGYAPVLASVLTDRAITLRYAKKLDEARVTVLEAIRIAEGAGDDSHKATALGVLVTILDDAGADSEAWRGMAIAASKRAGVDRATRALGFELEAKDLVKAGKVEDARKRWNDAFAIRDKIDDPLSWLQNRDDLATALRNAGGHDDEVFQIVRDATRYAAAHTTGVWAVLAFWQIANVLFDDRYIEGGHSAEVLALLDRGLAVAHDTPDAPPDAVALLHRQRASVRAYRREPGARDELDATLVGLDNRTKAFFVFGFVHYEFDADDFANALVDAKRAVPLDPDIAGVGVVEGTIGSLELHLDDPRSAAATLEHVRPRIPHDNIQYSRVTAMLGRAYVALGDKRGAALLEEALPVLEAHPEEIAPLRLADARFALARVLPQTDAARARALAEKARDAYAAEHAPELASVDAFLRR